ncbi:MgtC/SapB family protein [Hydrogenophaga palleronii]|uniref:MgtC/SapB family protein n=1 Tax=Hydrogenophaga palleronii TaxID=65655 RepID=UPI000825CA25|nr:MgtC/SapB family protein [Hydrogenophaga palleronii]
MPPIHPPELASAAATLAAALGCGLLIGVERERSKGDGPARAFAGLRTFALVCVSGAAAALLQHMGLVLIGAAFVAALGVVAYARDRSEDPGATTEVALLLTYLIGVVCVWQLPLAAAMAAALTALLAARERLHRFVNEWLRPAEIRDGILLAALVLVALPLMPNRPLWGPVLNPATITQLLALLLAVQSLAHLCRRLLHARQAVAFSAFASGFVSSTATIATLGMSARRNSSEARLMAGGGLLSCVATLLQMLLVAAAVRPAWLSTLWLPALAGGCVAVVWGVWLVRGAPVGVGGALGSSPHTEGLGAAQGDRMFSLRGAMAIAALLAGIQVLVHALDLWLGQAGVLAGTLLASLVDLHSALAAVFVSSEPPQAGVPWALMLALGVHALSKSVTAALSGGVRYAAWLVPGLLVHTGLCMALLAV